jgi:hypothetical protein
LSSCHFIEQIKIITKTVMQQKTARRRFEFADPPSWTARPSNVAADQRLLDAGLGLEAT